MRDVVRLGPASALLGWLLFYAVGVSYLMHPEAAESCVDTEVLWASWWFFAPPVLGVVGALASIRKHSRALLAATVLVVVWLPAAAIWMLMAIVNGATCHGG